MPLNVPVPFPLSMKVTPDGSGPATVNCGAGTPVVVTVNVPGAPRLNVVAAALVIAGAWLIVRVKLRVTGGRPLSVAVNVSGWLPPVPAPGVPASVAVRSPLSMKVTPAGSVPVTVSVGGGVPPPLVVTENVRPCQP